MSSFTEENNQLSEMQENQELLGGLPLFVSFPLKAIKLLAYLAQRATYGKGETVFEEGDDFGRLIYIISGELILQKKSGTNKVALQKYQAKDFLGSFSLLGSVPSLFALESSTTTTVLTINREQFCKILEQFPEAAMGVTKYFLNELYQWERRNLTHAETCCLNNSGATVL